MTANGDVAAATVADSGVRNRDEAVYGSTSHQSWRRIVLLIIAITVHNIPGHLLLNIQGVTKKTGHLCEWSHI